MVLRIKFSYLILGKLALNVFLLFMVLVLSCGRQYIIITHDEAILNLQQVTETEYDEYDPNISFDGTVLVYVSSKTGNGDIYLKTPPQSKATTQLTFHSAPDRWPCVSSDNKQVAFASLRSGNWDIYSLNIEEGPAVTQVTQSLNDEICPDYSPDCKKIAYMAFSPYDREWYVWIADLEKGTFTQLGRGMYPKWSPDGTKIAYQKAEVTGKRWFNIWVYDFNTRTETQVTPGDKWGAITPSWSPDSKHICFSTSKMQLFGTRLTSEVNMTRSCLFIGGLPVVGGLVGLLIGKWWGLLIGSGAGLLTGLVIGFPRSQKIETSEPIELSALCGSDLWRISITGMKLQQLTSHESSDWQPAWDKTNHIYFLSNRSGNTDIWVIETAK